MPFWLKLFSGCERSSGATDRRTSRLKVAMPGTDLSEEEIRLAKDWKINDGVAPSQIAKLLKRNKSTITRLFRARTPRKTRGPNAMLSETQIDTLVAKLKDMIVKAKGRKEITVAILKKSARCKASLNTIRAAIHARGIYFYAMRLKPLLTDQDIKDRYDFARNYIERPRNWWVTHLHLIIDVKFFPVFLNTKARQHAAQTGCRGVYREEGQGLSEGYYKPNPKLKYNTGAKGIHVLAGVGNGKVLLWEYIQGRWNSHEAERIYKGPMLKVLQQAYPSRRRYNVLEDNDPAGFRSKIGMKAKEEAHIDTFEIPRHSPQLNLCDYFLWAEVNKRMRETERKWPQGKKEERSAYLRRLTRTAKSLPSDMINKAIGHMKVRCERLLNEKGGQIEG